MEGLSSEIKKKKQAKSSESSGPGLPVVHLHVVFGQAQASLACHFHVSFDCLGRPQTKLVSVLVLSRRAGPEQFSLLMV